MTANTSPIFTLTPDISTDKTTGRSQPVTAAIGASYDGTHANMVLVHTADANGSYVDRIRCTAAGSNVATVARLFANNGSTNGTAANNCPIDQISLPATTANNAAATPTIVFPLGIRLKAGERLYIGLGTAVAAGWAFVAESGQY
jgi:hypothetical protein